MRKFILQSGKEQKNNDKKIYGISKSEEIAIQIRLIKAKAYSHYFEVELPNDNVYEPILVREHNKRPVEVEVSPMLSHCSCTCGDFLFQRINTCLHVEAVKRLKNESYEFSNLLKQKMDKPSLWFDSSSYSIVATGNWTDEMLSNLGLSNTEFSIYDRTVEIDDLAKFSSSLVDNVRIVKSIKPNYINKLLSVKSNEELKLWAKSLTKEEVSSTTKQLYPFQEDGVKHLLATKRAILADDMGLGKTITAVSACQTLFNKQISEGVVLIVCPASLKHQWVNEIRSSTNNKMSVFYNSADVINWFKAPTDVKFIIVNYELVQRNSDLFSTGIFDVIILDEAQRLRNFETKTWKAISKLNSEYLFVLSGTIIENKIADLYSVMKFINKDVLGPEWEFNYSHMRYSATGKLTNVINLSSLRQKLKSIVLRRTKDQVAKDLPEFTPITRYVQMTPEQIDLEGNYREQAVRLLAIAATRELSFAEKQIVQKCLLKARQACNAVKLCKKESTVVGSPKLTELEEIVSEILLEGKKMIIFSEWVEMLELIAERFKTLQYKYVMLHGGIPNKKREEIINHFMTDDSCKIFLSSDAGGVGLNLQAASYVIHMDLPWNPARVDQRNGRAHRIKQTEKVTGIYLVAEKGIERGIEGLYVQKRAARVASLDSESTIDNISIETFNSVLSLTKD